MYNNIKIGVILAFFLSFANTGNSQNRIELNTIKNKSLNFQHFDVTDGLSQSTVNSIFQDNNNYLWFATDNGLNRYDGTSFKVFLFDPKDPNTISANVTSDIKQDENGNLWITTSNGLSEYDYSTNKFTRYLDIKSLGNLEPVNLFTSLIVDKSEIWVGTEGKGLIRVNPELKQGDNGFVTYFQKNEKFSPSLSSNIVRCLYKDKKGRLWIGNSAGLELLVDKSKGIFRKIKTIEGNTFQNELNVDVWKITEDSEGKIIIGTSQGLYIVEEGDNNSFVLHEFCANVWRNSIGTGILSILVEKNGDVWFSAYRQGLFLYKKNDNTLYRIIDKNDADLIHSTIFSMMRDSSGVLWIGKNDGILKLSQ